MEEINMRNYTISTNSKVDKINKIDNTVITSNTPLYDLQKLLPDFTIKRSNSWNWNITLWHKDTNTHLYYVAK